MWVLHYSHLTPKPTAAALKGQITASRGPTLHDIYSTALKNNWECLPESWTDLREGPRTDDCRWKWQALVDYRGPYSFWSWRKETCEGLWSSLKLKTQIFFTSKENKKNLFLRIQGFYIRGANTTEELAASQQVLVFVEADVCCSVW